MMDDYDVLFKTLMEQDSDNRIQGLRSQIEKGKLGNCSTSGGYSVLMVAVELGYVDCVRLLIEAGANVNDAHDDGGTALMIAARENKDDDCVLLLLEAGANVNDVDEAGDTALMEAAGSGQNCLRLLLEVGANVNSANKKGETALMHAARNRNFDFVRLLLEAGANVNCVDMEGNTALIYSLLYIVYNTMPLVKTLKLLVEAGADIDAQNQRNLQPIHYSLKMWLNFKFAAEYLISENCYLNQVSHDKCRFFYSCNEEHLAEGHRLDILKLLFACGFPGHLCQSFIVEQETSVKNWIETVASQPNTLKSQCVFKIRRSLGHGIKSKVSKLNLPNVIQNVILLRGILSLECFV